MTRIKVTCENLRRFISIFQMYMRYNANNDCYIVFRKSGLQLIQKDEYSCNAKKIISLKNDFFDMYHVMEEEAYVLTGVKELNFVLQHFKNIATEATLNIIYEDTDQHADKSIPVTNILEFNFEHEGITNTIEVPIFKDDFKK